MTGCGQYGLLYRVYLLDMVVSKSAKSCTQKMEDGILELGAKRVKEGLNCHRRATPPTSAIGVSLPNHHCYRTISPSIYGDFAWVLRYTVSNNQHFGLPGQMSFSPRYLKRVLKIDSRRYWRTMATTNGTSKSNKLICRYL